MEEQEEEDSHQERQEQQQQEDKRQPQLLGSKLWIHFKGPLDEQAIPPQSRQEP